MKTDGITTQMDEVFNYLSDNPEKNLFSYKHELDYQDKKWSFHFYGNKGSIQKSEHNLPMYIQILDQQAIKLYDAVKTLGGECLYRKSDCVVLRNYKENYKDYLSDEIGGLREEVIPHTFFKKTYNNVNIDWKNMLLDGEWFNNKNITDSKDAVKGLMMLYNQGQGCVLDGRAGSGKSYVLKSLRKEIGYDDCIVVSFTNMASKNVDGETFHKAFKLNDEEKMCRTTMDKLKDTKAILVDEGSMISGRLWFVLQTIHRELKIPIFVFVDWRQLEPVGDNEILWKNHPMLKEITSFNYARIEYNPEFGRYDQKLYDFTEKYQHLEDFRTNGKIRLEAQNETKKDLKVNICYTNRKRKEINNHLMTLEWVKAGTPSYQQSWINPKQIGTWVKALNPNLNCNDEEGFDELEEKIDNEHCQPIFLKGGLPLICVKNVKALDICNSERFELCGLDQSEIPEKTTSFKKSLPLFVIKNSEKELKLNIIEFFNYFSVGYAMTVHKAQGQSIDEHFTIWEVNNPRVNEKWLYTALTRATKLEYIHIQW
jgi:DNA replication protein DnaC